MVKQHLAELDYYFRIYWENNKIIQHCNINLPEVESDTNEIPETSIFALMFNNNYYFDEYVYNFTDIGVKYTRWSIPIRERLFCNYGHITSFISDSTGNQQIIFISDELENLFNKLLDFRLTGYADLSEIIYDELEYTLSKLIYIYLDGMINDEYNHLYDGIISEDTDVVGNLYEIYVVNELYNRINISEELIGRKDIQLRPGRTRISVTSDILTSKYFETNDLPYTLDYFYLFRNGDLLNSDYYSVSDSTASAIVDWAGYSLSSVLQLNDILIADYYVEIEVLNE